MKRSLEEKLRILLIPAVAEFAAQMEIRKPVKRRGELYLPSCSDIVEKHLKKFVHFFKTELEKQLII